VVVPAATQIKDGQRIRVRAPVAPP
jgi:hypothetical protein